MTDLTVRWRGGEGGGWGVLVMGGDCEMGRGGWYPFTGYTNYTDSIWHWQTMKLLSNTDDRELSRFLSISAFLLWKRFLDIKAVRKNKKIGLWKKQPVEKLFMMVGTLNFSILPHTVSKICTNYKPCLRKKDTGKDKQGVQQTTSVCSIEDVLFERTFNASQFLVNHYHWLNCLGGVCLM